jgi:hypothetical protein
MAFDTLTARFGMLGFGAGDSLAEASGSFDGKSSQLFLALPGTADIENGEAPPDPEPEETGRGQGSRRKLGIGR